MLDYDDIKAINDITDPVYGEGILSSPTHSITCALSGQSMTLKYKTVVRLPGHIYNEDLEPLKNEATSICKDYIKNLKKEFKKKRKKALKLKEKDNTDSLEMISMSPHSPVKTAYFRFNIVFEIG